MITDDNYKLEGFLKKYKSPDAYRIFTDYNKRYFRIDPDALLFCYSSTPKGAKTFLSPSVS